MSADGLYEIKVKGEKHTYEFRGSRAHSLNETCKVLSDLTGYKVRFLCDDTRGYRIKLMKIGQERIVKPADSWDGSPPVFVVKRVA